MNSVLKRSGAGATAAVGFALMISAADTTAQERETGKESSGEDEVLDEIVVTGSHIRGARIDGILPVEVISSDDVLAIAPDSGGALLTSLAQADVSEYEDIGSVDNASLQAARGDVRALNMRGLGPMDTLVLLNGRRVIQHPGTQFSGNVITTTVNTNTIPSRGIQRVEVLADGASALYGTDAVAGVVNTVLMKNFEGLTLSTTYGGADDSGLERRTISILGGQDFNEGRTNVSLSLNHYVQDGYMATALPFAASEDLRPLFEGTDFEGDLQLDNRATYTPWGVFRTFDRSAVRNSGGTLITNNSGLFHIQPNSMSDCRVDINDEICIDNGQMSRSLRLDSNPMRTLRGDVDRINAFAFVNHTFDSGLEFFGELGTYRGELSRQLEPGWFAPSTTFTVSKDAYWNPFGRMFLDNGELNPNRLPGIDAPVEGLDISIERYRPLDADPRRYTVTNRSHRVLGGLRGTLGDWSWESAAMWSWADTEDVTSGISNSAFFEAMNRTDETAYNPFNGFCVDDINGTGGTADCTPSPAQTIDDITVTAYRKNYTELGLVDFKLTREDLFNGWAGPVGAAVGAEVRYHSFEEDRDPRLDGTITYTDAISGVFSDSDLLGMSSTPDFDGQRYVYSAFAELLVPLVHSGMDVPLMSSLVMQLAGRFEDYDDVGSITKPKIAIGWHVVDSLQIRGSYTEGFRAPSLELVNAPAIIRSNNAIEDTYRCQAGVNKGLYEDVTSCDLSYGVVTPYIGNADIGPEHSESYAYGISYTAPFADDLIFTLNRWSITQESAFGGIGVQDTVELDWATRLTTGEAYPDVERAPVTQEDIDFYEGSGLDPAGELVTVNRRFLNLETRRSKGVDLGVHWTLRDLGLFGANVGDLRIKLSAAYLEKAFQEFTPALRVIQEVSEETNAGIVVTAQGDLRRENRRPDWRATGTFTWRKDSWGAGIFARYASDVKDTSLELDGPETRYHEFQVGTRVNVYANYTFRDGLMDGLTAQVGARNVFDRKPPLVDSTFAYPAWMSAPEGRYVYGRLTYRF